MQRQRIFIIIVHDNRINLYKVVGMAYCPVFEYEHS